MMSTLQRPLPAAVRPRAVRQLQFAKAIGFVQLCFALWLPAPAPASEHAYPPDRMCEEEQLCRRCDGPACMKVAIEQPWPAEYMADGLALELDNFRLMLPPAAEKIVYFGGGGIAVRYPGRKTITIEYERASQFGISVHQGKPATSHPGTASVLAFADTPRIQFTKTPDDAEPDDLADRRIWRLGLTLKDAAFAHTVSPFYAHRGSGTIFVRNGVSSPSDVTAHLVHASERDSYVTITSIGVARAEIVRVLGSIRPKERKQRA